MTTHDDVFFQVPQTVATTSEGDVALPILYYDASALYAFFLVDEDRAAGVLCSERMRPALTAAGRAVAAVACYEYRDTSVGVYNEVGLAVAVTADDDAPPLAGWPEMLTTMSRPESRHVGMHVLDLPVTTAAANAAGREIWGFPKFVTDIRFEHRDHRFHCVVADPDGVPPIMALAGSVAPALPCPPLSLALYTELEGRLMRCTVNARGRSRITTGRGLRLSAQAKGHRMSAHLSALGLDGATPLAVMWTDHFQSRLNAGVAVPSVDDARADVMASAHATSAA